MLSDKWLQRYRLLENFNTGILLFEDVLDFGLNFISLYTHVQNDNVINTNEQVNDIQNGIQKEVLGLM